MKNFYFSRYFTFSLLFIVNLAYSQMLQFDGIFLFSEGIAGVKVDDKWGYIDRTGKYIIAPRFDDVFLFNEKIVSVKVDGKWGCINKKGKYIKKSIPKALREQVWIKYNGKRFNKKCYVK